MSTRNCSGNNVTEITFQINNIVYVRNMTSVCSSFYLEMERDGMGIGIQIRMEVNLAINGNENGYQSSQWVSGQ